MNNIKVNQIKDDCLVSKRYEILLNNEFYTSNISGQCVKNYINKFKDLGYNIIN